VVGRQRPGVHDHLDELRHGRAVPVPLVGVEDVEPDLLGDVAVLQQRHEGRLVRDERPDVVGVVDDPPQRERAAAAGAEGVDGSQAGGVDDAVQVLGVQLRGHPTVRRQPAALRSARVVRDDGAVVEVVDELGEAGRRHRRPEDEQRWVPARRRRPADVVGQHGAGDLEGAGGRCRHVGSLSWVCRD
jgi:hypothetical protein